MHAVKHSTSSILFFRLFDTCHGIMKAEIKFSDILTLTWETWQWLDSRDIQKYFRNWKLLNNLQRIINRIFSETPTIFQDVNLIIIIINIFITWVESCLHKDAYQVYHNTIISFIFYEMNNRKIYAIYVPFYCHHQKKRKSKKKKKSKAAAMHIE